MDGLTEVRLNQRNRYENKPHQTPLYENANCVDHHDDDRSAGNFFKWNGNSTINENQYDIQYLCFYRPTCHRIYCAGDGHLSVLQKKLYPFSGSRCQFWNCSGKPNYECTCRSGSIYHLWLFMGALSTD